jgi:biotin carboxylase
MSKLFILHESTSSDINERIKMLVSSAEKVGIECIVLDSTKTDHSETEVLQKGSFLYNISRGSKHLELLMLNNQVTTFYRTIPEIVRLNTIEQAIAFKKAGILTPPTVFHSTNEKNILLSYTSKIGGFPIIIKISGGTKGVGTIITHDFASLLSIADYLVSLSVKFMLIKYIEPKEIARLIVIGNHVIASNRKLIPKDDFRTSVKNKLPEPKKYSEHIQKLAIWTAKVANSENCGIDILIDKENTPYVLEANMPHDFVTTVKATGIDVTGAMVDFLTTKASQNAHRINRNN